VQHEKITPGRELLHTAIFLALAFALGMIDRAWPRYYLPTQVALCLVTFVVVTILLALRRTTWRAWTIMSSAMLFVLVITVVPAVWPEKQGVVDKVWNVGVLLLVIAAALTWLQQRQGARPR
jgi:hypothetical protein